MVQATGSPFVSVLFHIGLTLSPGRAYLTACNVLSVFSFYVRVLLWCPGWFPTPPPSDPPASAFQVVGTSDMQHHTTSQFKKKIEPGGGCTHL